MSPKLFNIDTETLLKKVSHRKSLKSHRCLIPLNGFYVWKPFAKNYIPYYISPYEKTPSHLRGFGKKDDLMRKQIIPS